jgi:homogentisate 1,2-dioxygenase
MRTMTTAGDVNTQVGMASHIYLVTASMEDAYFYSADSELLIVPQEGRLRFFTELGIIDLEPQEIAIIPRGLLYRVEVTDGPARGFVCENYGQKFELPGAARSGPTAWPTGGTSRRLSRPSRIARCRPRSP